MASVLGLIALGVAGVGVTGLIRGRVAWARLRSRGVAGAVTAAAITVFLVIAVVSAPATRPKAASPQSAARSSAPPVPPSVNRSTPTPLAPLRPELSTASSLASPAVLSPSPSQPGRVAPLPQAPPPSSEAPVPAPAATPGGHCTNGPLPGQDVIFWSVVPSTPPTAAVLGQYTGTNCQSTIDFVRTTSPTGDGDCTLLALQSDNPGYNVNAADPVPRPRHVFLAVGPGMLREAPRITSAATGAAEPCSRPRAAPASPQRDRG